MVVGRDHVQIFVDVIENQGGFVHEMDSSVQQKGENQANNMPRDNDGENVVIAGERNSDGENHKDFHLIPDVCMKTPMKDLLEDLVLQGS